MSCFDSCLHCLSLVPWASLIALVICWAGTALFSGAAHAAITHTINFLNESNVNTTHIDPLAQNLKYSIYGISSFIFVLTILLFVDGLMATRAVKNDYDAGCKSTCWGLFSGIVLTIFTYLSGIGWLVVTCGATVPVYFFIVAKSQCDALNTALDGTPPLEINKYCIYFEQTGLVPPGSDEKLCGVDLQKFCNDQTVNLAEQLYMIALIGSAAALISMTQFLMSLSANYAYSKMIKKLSVYEDAKYREEMELNDIINTARSNERLTYKY